MGLCPNRWFVQSLKEKRAEILGRISAYKAQIAQAKHDLAHVIATIRLLTEPEKQRARYMVRHGFFKKGEIADICARHLGVREAVSTADEAQVPAPCSVEPGSARGA